MFQLYKQRNFGENISDSIQFLKSFGKDFFKSYFKLLAIPLIITAVCIFVLIKYFANILISNNNNPLGESNIQGFYDNIVVFGICFFILFLTTCYLSIIGVAYPSIYLKWSNGMTNEVSYDLIKKEIFEKRYKLLKFSIGFVFIIMPLLCFILIINMALVFIIIGILLFFISIPALISFTFLVFNEYIINDNRFFSSISAGFKMLFSGFWKNIGITIISYIILNVLQSIVTMIPYTIAMMAFFTSNAENNGQDLPIAAISIFGSLFFVFVLLFSMVSNNFLYISQALIFFSIQEDENNTGIISEIDLIGLHENE